MFLYSCMVMQGAINTIYLSGRKINNICYEIKDVSMKHYAQVERNVRKKSGQGTKVGVLV